MKSLVINNTNQAISENVLSNEYIQDMKKAEEMLFYRKEDILKYLNKNVPYFIFPTREFKIKDISFTIADYGETYIHLYLNDGSYETLHVKKGNISVYSPTGTIKIGNRVYSIERLISKTSAVLNSYFYILNSIMIKYPNRMLNFGKVNFDFIEHSLDTEKMIRNLAKKGR